MQRLGKLILVGFLLAIAVGCGSAAGAEPTAGPEPAVDQSSGTPDSSEVVSATTEAAGGVEYATTMPSSVDLSQITPEPAVNTTPVEMPRPGVPDPQVAMEQMVSLDLATYAKVDVSQVTVMSTTAVEWPDAGLGCAPAGSMSAMVITPGYQILLKANDQLYTYHTDKVEHFVLCGADGKPVSVDQ